MYTALPNLTRHSKRLILWGMPFVADKPHPCSTDSFVLDLRNEFLLADRYALLRLICKRRLCIFFSFSFLVY